MIVLAKTAMEELAALRAQTLAAMAAQGAQRWESEVWELAQDLRVQARVKMEVHRGAKRVPYVRWWLSGRRVGWNHLLSVLRKRDLL